MSTQNPERAGSRIIVVGNEKGGSGKSTVAMHIAVALLKAGQTVATLDLDFRQKSLTRYIENRRAWAGHSGSGLEIPAHCSLTQPDGLPEDESIECDNFITTVAEAKESHAFIIIDTPGHRTRMNQLVHAMADTLITPLNDSFLDFDVLGVMDAQSMQVTGPSHYAAMVQESRERRSLVSKQPTDWIVMRNRLSVLASRNKRLMGEGLEQLSRQLGFRSIDGLSERVIFREFFLRGLTALDDVNETTLGTRPTLSHVTARQEVQAVLHAMGLGAAPREVDNRDAA